MLSVVMMTMEEQQGRREEAAACLYKCVCVCNFRSGEVKKTASEVSIRIERNAAATDKTDPPCSVCVFGFCPCLSPISWHIFACLDMSLSLCVCVCICVSFPFLLFCL